MPALTSVKNFAIILIISLSIPALTHLYVSYFFQYPEYKLPGNVQQLQAKIHELQKKERIDLKSFEQGKIERNEIEKVEKEIQELENQISPLKEEFSRKHYETLEKFSTKRFIIVMIVALLSILSGIFISYPLLKTSFTTGGLLLVLYNFIYNWFSLTTLTKLVSMTIWFVLLILLVIYYHKKEDWVLFLF